jgi:hypothetical protein
MYRLMKRKVLLSTSVLLCITTLFIGCTEDDPAASTNTEVGYVRMIAVGTFATTTETRFYINEKINGNGDTAVYNKDGELVEDITKSYLPVYFSGFGEPDAIASGVYIDLKTPLTSGIYGFNSPGYRVPSNSSTEGYYGRILENPARGYFPDATHRLNLAPNVNNVSFHKWAAVQKGVNTFSFRKNLSKIIDFKPTKVAGPITYKADINIDKGSYYTMFYSQTANSSSDPPTEKLVVMKESPSRYQFNDSSTFIRFLNFIPPSKSDDDFNLATSSMDIYFVKNNTESTPSEEVLIQTNLRRFAADENKTDFFEIDMRDVLKRVAPFARATVDDLLPLDTILAKNTYSFRFYRSGESAAVSKLPLIELPVTMRYSKDFGVYGDKTGFILLTKDPLRFQPMIMTAIFSINPITTGLGGGLTTYKSTFIFYNFEPTNPISSFTN